MDKKIGICVSNKVGYQILKYIITKDLSQISFILTHDSDDEWEQKIYNLVKDIKLKIHRKINCNTKEFKDIILNSNIDLMMLLWWPQIIKNDVIDLVKQGILNLHPSLLPYNRGKHPYYWSIVDETPAGVSIHFITKNIDDGPVVFQKEIKTDLTTTGEVLYNIALNTIVELFKKSYNDILSFKFQPITQDNNIGTFHWGKNINESSEIDLSKNYNAKKLINIMRARTFSKGDNSYFIHNGEKYNIKIDISKDKKYENNQL